MGRDGSMQSVASSGVYNAEALPSDIEGTVVPSALSEPC